MMDCLECATSSGDFFEDAVGGHGPGQWSGFVVVGSKSVFDHFDQIRHRVEHSAAYGFVVEFTKPALWTSEG